MARKNLTIVQAGITGTKGNPSILNTSYRLSSVPMPIQPKNKGWVPRWSPFHPANQATNRKQS